MPFTLSEYLLVSAILLASSVLQGAVGFASALFGTPLLMLAGIPLPEAVAIILVASAVQNGMATWQLRRDIDLGIALRPMLIRAATLPLGAAVLWVVGRQHDDLASQLVGVIVLAIVVLQWSLRIPPQPKLHSAWEWLAMSLSGFLLGLCGMGGPPMVLWLMAHDWPMQKSRAFLYFQFAAGIPVQALFLWLFFGNGMLAAVWLGLGTLPALVVGLFLGMQLGKQFSDRTLRGLAMLTLVLIAISAIVLPLLK